VVIDIGVQYGNGIEPTLDQLDQRRQDGAVWSRMAGARSP
jgi:hypothetical protein